MCWLFKSKVNGHFGTLRGADSPSAVELRPAEVWKSGFCQNTKWPPEVWFGLEIFWSENKSFSFLWIIGGVQKLGPVRQKMSKLRLFFSFVYFAYFGYWHLRKKEGHFWRRGCAEQWNFFSILFPIYQLNITMGPSDEVFSPFWGPCSHLQPQNLGGLNQPPPPGLGKAPTTRGS